MDRDFVLVLSGTLIIPGSESIDGKSKSIINKIFRGARQGTEPSICPSTSEVGEKSGFLHIHILFDVTNPSIKIGLEGGLRSRSSSWIL